METSEKIALQSIAVNLGLVAIKAVLAVISGSLAIQADALHSLSDVVSAIVVWVGIRISMRSSRSFPYGLYKVENLVALGTSFLIVLAGYEIVKKVFAGSSAEYPGHVSFAVIGIGLTILITWKFSRYELKMAKDTGSPSLLADARHVWTDMLSSLVILAALLASAVGISLDRYAALVVVVFIGRAALTIFIDSVRVLLDASLDYASLDTIRAVVKEDLRVVEINDLRARNAGRYKFVELDLTLRVKELEKGHLVAEEIKQRIKTKLENVDHVQVHYAPQQKELLTVGIPLCADRQTISIHFGEAPFFRLVTLNPKTAGVSADHIFSNPHGQAEKGKGIKVAGWLLEQGLDLIVVRQDIGGKGPGFVLGNADVETQLVAEEGAEVALSRLKQDWCR